MRNKKILVTGGLGFIFSHVAEYFAKTNKVSVLDNLSDGSHPELLENWESQGISFVKGDVNDISNLIDSEFDYIIHAAAESNVDKSINNQKVFIESNINGTLAVLEYARNHQELKSLLYVNTDEVYGSSEEWCTPEMKLNPSNPYSASKASAGHLCWAYHNTYQLPIKEIRMCNIIGKRQANTKLIPRVIEYIQNDIAIPIYDGGVQTREYMDVRDVPLLIEKVLKNTADRIFNLTFNQELSTLEVINEVEKILNKKAIQNNSTRKGHDWRYRMSPHSIIFNDIGQKSEHHKFKDTINWMLKD